MNATLNDINRKAHAVLARELGPVEYLLFFRQYETGHGDYTRDRWNWLNDLTLDDIVKEAEQLESGEAA